jgi:hypothetical protein
MEDFGLFFSSFLFFQDCMASSKIDIDERKIFQAIVIGMKSCKLIYMKISRTALAARSFIASTTKAA